VATKFGRIARFGRSSPKFVEAYLDTGDRVELSPLALAVVRDHDPTEPLVFVERRGRIFHYVQWVGTPEEAIQALNEGLLRPNEIPSEIVVFGLSMASLRPRIEALRKERYEQAVLSIHEELPPGGTVPVLAFARFMSALLRLTEAQLAEVGRAFEGRDPDAWSDAFDALSGPALRVGFMVRWVRWPDPTDEPARSEFRGKMHPAAYATESAAAGLAEPSLTTAQRDALYSSFATVIPQHRLTQAPDADRD
jgi:hypothetical protein